MEARSSAIFVVRSRREGSRRKVWELMIQSHLSAVMVMLPCALMASAAVFAGEPQQASVKVATYFSWFSVCNTCSTTVPDNPITFEETFEANGSFFNSGSCAGAQHAFVADWSDNCLLIGTTSLNLFQQSQACLGPCECICIQWNGGLDILYTSSTPFFLACWSGLTGPEGLFQTEPKMSQHSGAPGFGPFDLRFTACREDFDASGQIDFSDVSVMLLFWGDTFPRLDLDGSGTLDSGDLSLLLLSWGECPW